MCTAGNDGGLAQTFLMEVISSTPFNYNIDATRGTHDIIANEISMNDQVGFGVKPTNFGNFELFVLNLNCFIS